MNRTLMLALSAAVGVAMRPAPATGNHAAPARAAAATAPRADELADSLIALERRSWEAWQARDSAFFRTFLSDDHVEVGFGGVTGKATVVAGVGSPACVVKHWAATNFVLHRLSETTALLTYHAEQETLCGGHPVPSPVWVSSLYVRRDGRWLNAAYQQTQTAR